MTASQMLSVEFYLFLYIIKYFKNWFCKLILVFKHKKWRQNSKKACDLFAWLCGRLFVVGGLQFLSREGQEKELREEAKKHSSTEPKSGG